MGSFCSYWNTKWSLNYHVLPKVCRYIFPNLPEKRNVTAILLIFFWRYMYSQSNVALTLIRQSISSGNWMEHVTWTCLLINFLSCWTSTSFLEARQWTSVVWASMRKEWFRSWTAVLDKTASLIPNCTSAPTETYPPSLVRIFKAIN